MKTFLIAGLTMILYFFTSGPSLASDEKVKIMDLTGTPYGIIALVLFVISYILVIYEERIHMRKSKPVVFASGIIWILVALSYDALGDKEAAHEAIKHNLTEYVELFLFLLVAMTYINAMNERNIFKALHCYLVGKGFTLRTIYWLTGLLAFFISPIADNMTTALLMGTVALAVGGNNHKFVIVACINIVVAANAGGAFSPFGDITTLMVWQKGKVDFFEFFAIFIPSVINWLIPAGIMSFSVSKEKPVALEELVQMKIGANILMVLFLATIVTAVSFHNFLHLPSAAGMMLGLSYLGFFAFWLKKKENRETIDSRPLDILGGDNNESSVSIEGHKPAGFDLFRRLAPIEWDTLLFFYGVILCVGGLGQFGYLTGLSGFIYEGFGHTAANIMIGIISSILDNIPVMFAVLSMDVDMSHGQWLLVTLTAGVGGSLLSIGSAAGVALMGSARGIYTFSSHLRWTWAIALGYIASIIAHLFINARYFH